MKLYNTMTRQKEEFTPIVPGKVGFYICGPTVYNHIHIGNARTFLSFDMIRRYMEYSGFEVTYVQNLTDVDDKIINRAASEGRSADEVAAEFSQAFIDAMDKLGVKPPTIRPCATKEIDSMVSLIEQLVNSGHAYAVDGDVYFAVRSFPTYGKLSGRDIEQLQSGARVEVDPRKRDALDFALWKAAKPGEPSWASPWGSGRPGWHIECSAMSGRYLGMPFDIHAGGDDLVFPHHENEIAQSEACSNVTFANYWLHGGMLTIDQEKMSKSEGNFLLLKDVLEYVSPKELRLLMLQTHYRSQFDYSAERLQEAKAAYARIDSALRNIKWLCEQYAPLPMPVNEIDDRSVSWTAALLDAIEDTRAQFTRFMDDDFNTAGAVSAIYELVTATNLSIAKGILSESHYRAAQDSHDTIAKLLAVLGVDTVSDDARQAYPAQVLDLAVSLAAYVGDNTNDAVDALLECRKRARADKNWILADKLRDELALLGLLIEDTPSGSRLVRKQ